jgi:MSHA biogenesis protein MshL
LQTRIFQVSYLTGLREGKSSLRVASGSVADVAITSPGTTGAAATSTAVATTRDSSKVTMTSSADFWDELSRALTAIVGVEKGRSVVISPMSGVIVVRAMPDELKNVAAYLKASQISIERQVILEAKIIEVKLSDTFQSGVNWSAFTSGPNSALSAGPISPGTTLGNTGSLTNGLITATPGTNLSSATANNLPAGAVAGTLFGLAFQTSNFAALLNFLEAQGDVHVLSSPRIATLNNQKAVLKVGTDEFFVTEVSGGTQATTTLPGTAPTVKVQPFFSGIALDVTPRIDENNEIILHVHPSVSTVSTVDKTVDLGTSSGGVSNKFILPLASSSVSETDSVVRARDGQIVAIGGLMRQASTDDESGMPLLPKTIFGQTSRRTEKRELVILLKPTVVDSDKDWSDDIARSRERINNLSR